MFTNQHKDRVGLLRTTARTSYCNSDCPSVCLSRPGTDSSTGEIETQGFYHMIA